MNTEFKKSFFRDLKKITDPVVKVEIERVIFTVREASAIKNIPNLRKMKGDKKGISYRIKVSDYRLSITIENNLVIFIACMHRKDIYKFFP
jgi:mRNA interferase RelE/StbE